MGRCKDRCKDRCQTVEGYVNVPERITPSQVIPSAQIFYKSTQIKNAQYTLFFINGFGNSYKTWTCQQKGLCKYFNTVTTDWRSVGKSSKTTGIVYNFDVFVDDFHEVISQLGLTNVVLIGQSVGSTMGIRYINKYPGEI